MINIKKIAKRILFAFLFIVISPFALLLIALLLLLLVDPYFFHIDSCLDDGGRWHEDIHECEYAPSGALLTPYDCEVGDGEWDYDIGECKLPSQK